MKKIYTMVSLLALLLLAATPASAQSVPDREMRSAWVATVWRLDSVSYTHLTLPTILLV